jgi:hypothetical protein
MKLLKLSNTTCSGGRDESFEIAVGNFALPPRPWLSNLELHICARVLQSWRGLLSAATPFIHRPWLSLTAFAVC